MKVVIIFNEEYPWDVRIEKFLGVLETCFDEVHLVARNRKGRAVRENIGKVVCHRLDPVNLSSTLSKLADSPAFFNPKWFNRIGSVVKEVKPDLVIVRDLPLVLTGRYWANHVKAPLVFDMAEDYPAMFSAYHPWETPRERMLNFVLRNEALARQVEKLSVRAADHILVVTEEQRDRLISGGTPAGKITIIRNTPVSTARAVAAAHTSARNGLELIYVGEVHHFRGLDCAIRAVGRLARNQKKVRLRLLGKGKTEDVLKKLAQEEAPNNIEFLGWVDPEAAREAVGQSDVGLVPHVRTKFTETTVPNKIYDYMASGIPVVTSDPGPLKRLVNETRCGLVYPSGDDAAMAEAIDKLQDAEMRAEFGDNGRRAVLEKYNWAVDAKVLKDTLMECAKGPKC